MGRIFTTTFVFQGKTYTALVSLNFSATDISIKVHLEDTDLHKILPEGKLNYQGSDGFRNLEHQSELAQELMQCIAHSIEKHMTDHP
jgi:hypothetical protein